MKPILFLEGEKGIGKSTMILEASKKYGLLGAGIFSQRLTGRDGETKGFRLIEYTKVSESIVPYEPDMEHIFLESSGGGRICRMEVFEQAKELAGNYLAADYIVLDEIGGIELGSQAFGSFLEEVLSSNIPCIGVLKSRENYAHMKKRVLQAGVKEQDYEKFREKLVTTYGAAIWQLTHENKEETRTMVDSFFMGLKDVGKGVIYADGA